MRFEIPMSLASWMQNGVTIYQRLNEHSIDTDWPWWQPWWPFDDRPESPAEPVQLRLPFEE